jgi:hypothetical protein
MGGQGPAVLDRESGQGALKPETVVAFLQLAIAAIIGLGYEKERALGIQQLLDPHRTILFVPKSGDAHPFYAEIVAITTSCLEYNRNLYLNTRSKSLRLRLRRLRHWSRVCVSSIEWC